MTSNDDLMKKLNEHGEVLARLDERTSMMVDNQDQHNTRLTYLERRDTIGNILSSFIAALAAGLSIFNRFDN